MQLNPVQMYVNFEKAIHAASNIVWSSITYVDSIEENVGTKDSTAGAQYRLKK